MISCESRKNRYMTGTADTKETYKPKVFYLSCIPSQRFLDKRVLGITAGQVETKGILYTIKRRLKDFIIISLTL